MQRESSEDQWTAPGIGSRVWARGETSTMSTDGYSVGFARPSRRTETDLDIIMSRMKVGPRHTASSRSQCLSLCLVQSMVVFERYPEAVLHELSRVVLYDTHLANTTRELLSFFLSFS